MTIEHNDFQQVSASNDEPQQKPQYHGRGLGDASFVEDDDDSEFLLEKALARDGLYHRGMSSVILSLTILSQLRLILTRQLQESVFFPLYTIIPLATLLVSFSRPGSYTTSSAYNANTFDSDLPLS